MILIISGGMAGVTFAAATASVIGLLLLLVVIIIAMGWLGW